MIDINSDRESPWKLPLWILTSTKAFHFAMQFTFQFFIASVINFMTLSDIL